MKIKFIEGTDSTDERDHIRGAVYLSTHDLRKLAYAITAHINKQIRGSTVTQIHHTTESRVDTLTIYEDED